ncbi:MAG: hypothetical protein KF906_08385 [Actinobacteria bacterium]|nr:hypothetical protein [Actinomycetota bacterium]
MTADGPVTFELDGPEATERRLASIAAERREADRIRDRITVVEAELETLEVEEAAALARVDAEEADVRELQRFTIRGIVADLRGLKDEEIRREAAEVAVAHHDVLVVRERQAAVVRELDSLQDRLVALGDPDAEWSEAVRDHRRWIAEHGDEHAERLTGLAVELGELDDERRECDDARAAAVDALAALDDVDAALADGSGDPADDEHPERLDALCGLVRAAEDALRSLATELADLGLRLTTPDRVERWDRAFSCFFDGLVGDEVLDARLAESAEVVGHALERVGRVAADVDERSRALSAREVDLLDERRELLEDVLAPEDQM